MTRQPSAVRQADDFELLLIDGNNLLHRLSGGVDEVAQRNLLGRLRGLVERPAAGIEPPRIILVLDGMPAPGSPRRLRVSARLEVRQEGNADRALLALLEQLPYADRSVTLLVTDDRALSDKARRLGCRSRRLEWLQRLLEGPSGRTIGGTPPRRLAQGQQGEADDDEREGWRPGRGATRKKGNPRRAPRRR